MPASLKLRRTVLAATSTCTCSADWPLGVELGGSIQVFIAERPSIPLGDAVASDVAEGRRPVHPEPERCRELFHWDASAVGGDQVGHFVGREMPLDRQRGPERIGRVDRSLARALS